MRILLVFETLTREIFKYWIQRCVMLTLFVDVTRLSRPRLIDFKRTGSAKNIPIVCKCRQSSWLVRGRNGSSPRCKYSIVFATSQKFQENISVSCILSVCLQEYSKTSVDTQTKHDKYITSLTEAIVHSFLVECWCACLLHCVVELWCCVGVRCTLEFACGCVVQYSWLCQSSISISFEKYKREREYIKHACPLYIWRIKKWHIRVNNYY